MTVTNTPHALYRFYGDDGALLYVGITNNPGGRWTQHRADKPWWHEVRGITLEPYTSRDTVLAAERRAIDIEQPRYNKQRPKHAHRRASAPAPTEQLVWLCDTCHQPVTDGTGYIHLNEHHVQVAEQQNAAWEARNTDEHGWLIIAGDAWADMPDDVPWQTHHAACDPDPDSPDYIIEIERARTVAHLLDWTLHLMEKVWLDRTNWTSFVRRHTPGLANA